MCRENLQQSFLVKFTWPCYCIQSNLHQWFFISICTSWWRDDWYEVDNSTCKSCTNRYVLYYHSTALSSQRWCCAYMCCGDWMRRGLASAEFWPGEFWYWSQRESGVRFPPMQPENQSEFVLVELSLGKEWCYSYFYPMPCLFRNNTCFIMDWCYRSI